MTISTTYVSSVSAAKIKTIIGRPKSKRCKRADKEQILANDRALYEGDSP